MLHKKIQILLSEETDIKFFSNKISYLLFTFKYKTEK